MKNEVLMNKVVESLLKCSDAYSVSSSRSDSYFFKSLMDLSSMILNCGEDAIGNYSKDYPTLGMRVIRLNKPVPKEILRIMDYMSEKEESEGTPGLYKRCFCSGLYITLPVVHIPRKFLDDKCSYKMKKGNLYHIKDVDELINLNSHLVESSLRLNSDGSAIVLIQNPITDYIYLGSHYRMLEIY